VATNYQTFHFGATWCLNISVGQCQNLSFSSSSSGGSLPCRHWSKVSQDSLSPSPVKFSLKLCAFLKIAPCCSLPSYEEQKQIWLSSLMVDCHSGKVILTPNLYTVLKIWGKWEFLTPSSATVTIATSTPSSGDLGASHCGGSWGRACRLFPTYIVVFLCLYFLSCPVSQLWFLMLLLSFFTLFYSLFLLSWHLSATVKLRELQLCYLALYLVQVFSQIVLKFSKNIKVEQLHKKHMALNSNTSNTKKKKNKK
jgi:hypothetical protein